jgi:SAM-dependent methyltransferase
MSPPPFESPDVVDAYEDWLATPWGRLVEGIEVDLLQELLAPVPARARVLDIGCGTGWLGSALLDRGWSVSGVDFSPRMLARARQRFPVVRGDAARLPFRDGAVDAAVVSAVLDFVPDPVAVLREARRVARRRVVVLALARNSWLATRRRIAGRRGHPIFSRARFYSRSELIAFARAAGAEPEGVTGAVFLPPTIGGRLPALERALRGRRMPCAGLIAFSLRGSAPPIPVPSAHPPP